MQLMKGEILTSLGAAPRIMERLLRVLPNEQLDQCPPGSTLTPREAIQSLAQNEVVILDRIRLAHTRPGSEVEALNPLEKRADLKLNGKDVFHEAEVFESRRMMTLEYLQSLDAADWDKALVLSGQPVDLNDYVGLVLASDLAHLDQITRLLATEVATHS
jgi:hypothetical protein